MMTFGGQTVKFIVITPNTSDPNGMGPPIRTPHTVSGCRFRPLKPSEKVGLASLSTEVWQLTAPPAAAVLAGRAIDEVLYDGTSNPSDVKANRWQIVGGGQPFTDMSSTVHKVTVLCQKQT